MAAGSIFYRMEQCVKAQGELPEDFILENKENKENELRYAPGALEGICGHHLGKGGDAEEICALIKEYLEMDPKEAWILFESREAKDCQIATIRKELLESIYENRQEYDAGKLKLMAATFISYGYKVVSVKLGLILLTLFDLSDNEGAKRILKVLAYSEEFTDYVIWNTAGWKEEEKQDFYFELAKKLKGWGKINVVEMMKADTAEKKEWLLCHGCKNTVLYAYLGYECAMKCDLYERLQAGNFSSEEFAGASDIIAGLLDEGPCQGMSVMDEPVELALLYLEECKKHNWDAEQVALITDLASYFKNSEIEDAGRVVAKAQEVLERLDLNVFIVENIENNTHNCMRIADMYDIDMSEHLLRLMKMDFPKYYQFCYYFFRNDKCIDDFMELCDRKIDYDKYPNEMGNSLGLGAVQGEIRLDMIVQYLDKHYRKGSKLIKVCIQSPITRWRNMAAKAMLGWVKESERDLRSIDIELYNEVKRVYETELNEQTKAMWEKLL